MKIKEFIKRYKIVLFLSFLVMMLIVLKLRYSNSDKEIPIITPTPTPIESFTEQYPEEMMEISE